MSIRQTLSIHFQEKRNNCQMALAYNAPYHFITALLLFIHVKYSLPAIVLLVVDGHRWTLENFDSQTNSASPCYSSEQCVSCHLIEGLLDNSKARAHQNFCLHRGTGQCHRRGAFIIKSLCMKVLLKVAPGPKNE